MKKIPLFELVRRILAAASPDDDPDLVENYLIPAFYRGEIDENSLPLNERLWDADCMSPMKFFMDRAWTLWQYVHTESRKDDPDYDFDLKKLFDETIDVWKLHQQPIVDEAFLQECINIQSSILISERKVIHELYNFYQIRLNNSHPAIRSIGMSDEDVEDVLQDTMILLWEKLRAEKFDRKLHFSNLGGFIYRIFVRRLIKRAKAKGKFIPFQIEMEEFVKALIEFPKFDDLDPPGKMDLLLDPDIFKEKFQQFAQEYPECFRLLDYQHYQNLSFDQIAKKMKLLSTSDSVTEKNKILLSSSDSATEKNKILASLRQKAKRCRDKLRTFLDGSF